MKKAWYKSRTIVFNGVMGTLAILETADLSFLPDGYGSMIVLVSSIGNLWLRTITTQPVGMSDAN